MDPTARILVLTMHQNAAYAVQAIRAGAKGCVTKSSPPRRWCAPHMMCRKAGSRSAPTLNMSWREAASPTCRPQRTC